MIYKIFDKKTHRWLEPLTINASSDKQAHKILAEFERGQGLKDQTYIMSELMEMITEEAGRNLC